MEAAGQTLAIERLRAATREVHHRLEARLDAVANLADPIRRPALLRRYAAFHIPADAALAPHLAPVEGLDLSRRSRAALLRKFTNGPLPSFPQPGSPAEALGMLYVLEGSTLGGRLILRTLAEHGVDEPDLAFLDPYGAQTGVRWRSFLAILERETAGEADLADQAASGAVRGFAHAEAVLCGDVA
jgi:heme oxygenase